MSIPMNIDTRAILKAQIAELEAANARLRAAMYSAVGFLPDYTLSAEEALLGALRTEPPASVSDAKDSGALRGEVAPGAPATAGEGPAATPSPLADRDSGESAVSSESSAAAWKRQMRARLDEGGTAQPKTEIVAVMPESAIGEDHKTVHVRQATHYIARPTRAALKRSALSLSMVR